MVKFTKERWVNLSEHKVPQNVESEDKILGPFSFRQFVYLLVAVGAGFVAFALGRIAIPLAILPMPVIALFLVLALPLKKDQTMEKYLAAIIKFLFMPHLRVWIPGESASGIEITTPSLDDDPIATKIQGDVATQRLSYLAEVEDTQGRGGFEQTNLNDEYANLDVKTPDILDENAVSESFTKRLDARDREARAAAMARIQNFSTQNIANRANTQNVASQNVANPPAAQNFSAQNSNSSAQGTAKISVAPQNAQNTQNWAAQNPISSRAPALQNSSKQNSSLRAPASQVSRNPQTQNTVNSPAAPQTFSRAAQNLQTSAQTAQNSSSQTPNFDRRATVIQNSAASTTAKNPQSASPPQNPNNSASRALENSRNAPQNPKNQVIPQNLPTKNSALEPPTSQDLAATDIDNEQAVENLLNQSRAAASATNIAPNGRVVQPLSAQSFAEKSDENSAKKSENPSPAPDKNAENVNKIENANLADFTQKLRDQVAQNLKNSAKKADEDTAPAPEKNDENREISANISEENTENRKTLDENPGAENENASETADKNGENPQKSENPDAENPEKNATMESESAISAPNDDDAAAADYAVSDDGMELDLH